MKGVKTPLEAIIYLHDTDENVMIDNVILRELCILNYEFSHLKFYDNSTNINDIEYLEIDNNLNFTGNKIFDPYRTIERIKGTDYYILERTKKDLEDDNQDFVTLLHNLEGLTCIEFVHKKIFKQLISK